MQQTKQHILTYGKATLLSEAGTIILSLGLIPSGVVVIYQQASSIKERIDAAKDIKNALQETNNTFCASNHTSTFIRIFSSGIPLLKLFISQL